MRDILNMMQLCDSMFPSGLFSTSNGIESMYLAGEITSARDLEGFCSTYLQNQVGPTDCVAATLAYKYATTHDTERIEELDQKMAAIKTIQETRKAYQRSGMQTARCAASFVKHDTLGWYVQYVTGTKRGSHPIAIGICCRAMGLDGRMASLVTSYGFVSASMGAGLRLGIIHHIESQQIMSALQPEILRAAEYGYATEEMWQFCPQAEIMQMSHEDMDAKMFIT